VRRQSCTVRRYAVSGCKLKQNANQGCNSCASLAGLVLSFIACFILLVIAPLEWDFSLLTDPELGVFGEATQPVEM